MTAELKPCPFCGGKPHSRTEADLDGIGRFYWFECGGCKARSGEKFATETCPQFYEGVRDAWNRRATQPQTDALQAMIDAAVKEAREGVMREAMACCQVVADDSKGYNIPQMAMGAATCRDAILAKIGGAS